MGVAGAMDVAAAGGRRLIPAQRRDGDIRPRLYLVPPLPADEPDSPEPACPAADELVCDAPSATGGWDAEMRRRLPVHSSEPPARRREPSDERPAKPEPRRASRAPVQAARQPVRLTRRGRAVVSLLLIGFMIGIAMLLAPAIQASPPAGPMRTVVVEPGDTLWSISTAALPSEDPYQAVDQVRRLNHMSGDSIFVGQQLTLPPAR